MHARTTSITARAGALVGSLILATGLGACADVGPRAQRINVGPAISAAQPADYSAPIVPASAPAPAALAAEANPAPDFVFFNGVANQYKDGPIQVPTGERVRLFVLNAGPSVDSAFHIVGTIFDTVIKEGVKLERGNEGSWGSQAVDLAPAQGAIVEFELAEDGTYPIVTHAFNLVGRGALGFFQAGDGDPKH